jgi:hypothetical protein
LVILLNEIVNTVSGKARGRIIQHPPYFCSLF